MKEEPSQPTFLVGAERSGTTMLRLMLSHHSELAWSNEFEYAVDRIGPGGELPDMAEYRDWLASHRIFLAAKLAIDPALDYPSLVGGFLEQLRQREGKPRVGATVHRRFDRLLHVWPQATFIHLLRDGRDVARSCIGMGWAGNVWTGVERWLEAEELWAQLCRKVPPERRYGLKYEELVQDPAGSLAGICRFLGVEYDPAMLDYATDTSYERPDPRLISQWKTKQTEHEVRLIESRIGPMLLERGYAPSGLPPLKVSAWARAKLRIQDRAFRIRFAQRRYGLRLWLSAVLARRIGNQAWRDSVLRRTNEIQARHLR